MQTCRVGAGGLVVRLWDAAARRTTEIVWATKPNRGDSDIIILAPCSFYSTAQCSLIQRTIVQLRHPKQIGDRYSRGQGDEFSPGDADSMVASEPIIRGPPFANNGSFFGVSAVICPPSGFGSYRIILDQHLESSTNFVLGDSATTDSSARVTKTTSASCYRMK
jgi:hypothetical protein